jgi:hypothetical protein
MNSLFRLICVCIDVYNGCSLYFQDLVFETIAVFYIFCHEKR